MAVTAKLPTDRDGTSQAGRRLGALDPAYVAVDERTVEDGLDFVRQYAKQLRYFDDENREAGDWSALLPDDLDTGDVAAFMADPAAFDARAGALLRRPHLTLLLAFLELLRHARGKLNTLTRRHLDFYYRQVLRLDPRPAVPDRVRLIFALARGVETARVSAGALLDAGPDSRGTDRVYATDRDLVVYRARIARLSSIRVEQRITGLTEVRDRYRNDTERATVSLFEIALGDPPGDPLPPYPPTAQPVDFELLTGLYASAQQGEDADWDEAWGHFFMTAREFAWVMGVATRTPESPATAAEWEKADAVLIEAHRRKVWAGRRAVLEAIRTTAGLTAEEGFTAMLRHALGEEPAAGDDPGALDRLEPYLGKDRAALEKARDAGDWTRAVELVEIAWRNREGLAPPVPRKVEWINLHPAADATVARVELGVPGELERWRTFGRLPPTPGTVSPETVPPPVIGWALRSPILALAEGERTIRITLGFDPEGFDGGALLQVLGTGDPFHVEASTEKGWAEPATVAVSVGAYATFAGTPPRDPALEAIRFELTFAVDAAPITAPAEASPVLRLMLRQVFDADLGRYRSLYPSFRDLLLAAVHVAVDVRGLSELALANDETTLDAAKPFEPFGAGPAVGSRLVLGHPELVAKRLDSVTFHLAWMGAPADLETHYANYEDLETSPPPEFTARVGLVDRKLPLTLDAAASLFPDTGALEITNVGGALPQGYSYGAAAVDTTDPDPRTWSRYLEWELNAPDFQHQAYPALATAKAIELAVAIARPGEVTADAYKVNPPYTPKLRSLGIDYTSSLEIRLEDGPSGDGRILHVHPFGTSGVESVQGAGAPFLPRYDDGGELLIGLADVRAPQTVTLFFQMAEGSADPDLERQPVRWHSLSADRWRSLDDAGHVLADSTGGLINSGIVELVLEPSAPSTRLPGDLYWLRASVAANSTAVCDTVAIHTQAVEATFVDRGNAPDHFDRPLPAATITELVERRPEIAAVRQPYTSYGGRRAEEESLFNTRVSERLRHKGRALTTWDYERLVLERFPEVYKVKAVPGARPGAVDVVVIPDVRHKLPFDPFEPKAPAHLLAAVESYLAARAPAAATVVVRNPHYVAVKVRVAVRFRARGNEDFDRRQLTEELNRHLSPWAYDDGADVVIGGKIYAHSLVDFLDRRPYVDFLADLRLFRSEDGEIFHLVPPAGDDAYAVAAERPDGVLVAAREHVIDLISETGYESKSLTGINFMKLELDFVIAEDV